MMNKTIAGLLSGLLFSLMLLPAHAQAPENRVSWRAEFYDNPSLSGYPVLNIIEHQISYDWGTGSPAPEIPADQFSARWTGTRYFEAGSHAFILSVDDGARLWFDGQLLIDAWDLGYQADIKTQVYIEEAGYYELQVAYFDMVGPATIQLQSLMLAGKDELPQSWQGEYFTNPNLEGEPVLVRRDPTLAFNWNGGAPDPLVTRDNFSVRWTRSVYLRGGFYTLKIQHDDGMRIYVDDKIVYDSWYEQPVTYVIRQINLAEGFRNFRVEFFDHVRNATARVTFEPDPGDFVNFDAAAGEAGVTVDNTSPRFTWQGAPGNQQAALNGFNDDYFWIPNRPTPRNSGKWVAPVGGAGNYEVFAYIPHDATKTTAARYQIFHYGEVVERVINQAHYQDEWVSLGTYYFGALETECIILHDNTPEAPGSTRIVFDALKFVQR